MRQVYHTFLRFASLFLKYLLKNKFSIKTHYTFLNTDCIMTQLLHLVKRFLKKF
jgi:hypothetical protein